MDTNTKNRAAYKRNRHIDVGGIGCACCRPLNTKAASRRYLGRAERRRTRVELHLITRFGVQEDN